MSRLLEPAAAAASGAVISECAAQDAQRIATLTRHWNRVQRDLLAALCAECRTTACN